MATENVEIQNIQASDNYRAPMAPDASKAFMSIDEIAYWIGIGKNTVRNWIDDGVLEPGAEYFKEGSVLRILPQAALKKLLARSAALLSKREENEGMSSRRRTPKSQTRKVATTRKQKVNLDY